MVSKVRRKRNSFMSRRRRSNVNKIVFAHSDGGTVSELTHGFSKKKKWRWRRLLGRSSNPNVEMDTHESNLQDKLSSFRTNFKKEHGRLPTKVEEAPTKSLRKIYRRLENEKEPAGTSKYVLENGPKALDEEQTTSSSKYDPRADITVYKDKIKEQLMRFDMEFLAKHGRLPTKQEKAPMRSLYRIYTRVKKEKAMLDRKGHREPEETIDLAETDGMTRTTASLTRESFNSMSKPEQVKSQAKSPRKSKRVEPISTYYESEHENLLASPRSHPRAEEAHENHAYLSRNRKNGRVKSRAALSLRNFVAGSSFLEEGGVKTYPRRSKYRHLEEWSSSRTTDREAREREREKQTNREANDIRKESKHRSKLTSIRTVASPSRSQGLSFAHQLTGTHNQRGSDLRSKEGISREENTTDGSKTSKVSKPKSILKENGNKYRGRVGFQSPKKKSRHGKQRSRSPARSMQPLVQAYRTGKNIITIESVSPHVKDQTNDQNSLWSGRTNGSKRRAAPKSILKNGTRQKLKSKVIEHEKGFSLWRPRLTCPATMGEWLCNASEQSLEIDPAEKSISQVSAQASGQAASDSVANHTHATSDWSVFTSMSANCAIMDSFVDNFPCRFGGPTSREADDQASVVLF